MLQICNCLTEENQSFMWKFFEKREMKYELQTKYLCQTPNVKTNIIGADSYPEVPTFGAQYPMI